MFQISVPPCIASFLPFFWIHEMSVLTPHLHAITVVSQTNGITRSWCQRPPTKKWVAEGFGLELCQNVPLSWMKIDRELDAAAFLIYKKCLVVAGEQWGGGGLTVPTVPPEVTVQRRRWWCSCHQQRRRRTRLAPPLTKTKSPPRKGGRWMQSKPAKQRTHSGKHSFIIE